MSRYLVAVAIACLLGCARSDVLGTDTAASAPAADGAAVLLPRSRDQLPAITVGLLVDRATAAPGDTVVFTASATNGGGQRVQIGVACGPSLDVAVLTPARAERSALADLVGPNGGFTCPLLESHFADPGETEAVRIRWRVPAERGTYTAVAGLRRGDGLGNVSVPVTLSVR
jgi:hypothetical protein